MAWEHADLIFPEGYTFLDNNEYISNEALRTSGIEIIYKDKIKQACNMTIKKERYLWHSNGELEIINLYDIYSQVPHASLNVFPLNVYGMAMINDYLAINNIQF